MSASSTTLVSYQQLATIDYLDKKTNGNKVKTDGLQNQTAISALNEQFAAVDIVRSDRIWADSTKLTNGPSVSAPALARTKIQCIDIHNRTGVDVINDLIGRSWKAPVDNWIPPDFHPNFTLVIFRGTSGSTPTLTIDSSAYPWSFDYGSGILTFLGNVPPYLASGAEVLYISGYTYTGIIGTSAVSDTFTAPSLIGSNVVIGSLSFSNERGYIDCTFTSFCNLKNIDVMSVSANSTNGWINMTQTSLSNLNTLRGNTADITKLTGFTNGGVINVDNTTLSNVGNILVNQDLRTNSVRPISANTISFNGADVTSVKTLYVSDSINIAGELTVTNIATSNTNQLVINNDGLGTAFVVNQAASFANTNVAEFRLRSNAVAFINGAGQAAFGAFGPVTPSTLPTESLVYIENPSASNQSAIHIKQNNSNYAIATFKGVNQDVVITAGGRIGIGSVLPAARINAVSDGTTDFVRLQTSTNSNAFVVDATGRIGVLRPYDSAYAVNVNGTINTDSIITSNISSHSSVINVSTSSLSNVNKLYANQSRLTTLGTSNAPAYTFESDDNTGLYSPGGDSLAVTTAGFERLRVTSDGRVGINTTTPYVQFQVDGTDALRIPVGTTLQRPQSSNALPGSIRYNSQLSSFEGFGPGNDWGSLGGVKDVAGTTFVSAEETPGNNDCNIRFVTAGVESMRVAANRNVGIGTTIAPYRLTVNGETSAPVLYTSNLSTLSPSSNIDVSQKTLSNINTVIATTADITYLTSRSNFTIDASNMKLSNMKEVDTTSIRATRSDGLINMNTTSLSNLTSVITADLRVSTLRATLANGQIDVQNSTLCNVNGIYTCNLVSHTGVINVNASTLSNVAATYTDKVYTPSIESLTDQLSLNWARVIDVDSLVVRSNISILMTGTNTISNLPTDVVRLDALTGKILDAYISSNIVRIMNNGQINPALIPNLSSADRASFVKSMDKVGIGLRNPAQKLHVYGNQAITGGRLGIGTTVPLSSIHVYDDNASIGAESIRIQSVGSTDMVGIYGACNYPVMFVGSTCNIGIRTNTPAYPLDVVGKGRITTVRTSALESDSGTINCSCNILSNVFKTDIQQATIRDLTVTDNLYVPQNITTTTSTVLNLTSSTINTSTLTSGSSHIDVTSALNVTGYDESLYTGSNQAVRIGIAVSEYILTKATLTVSDQRTKTDIVDTVPQKDLDALLSIPVKTFKYKTQQQATVEPTVGFLAQDIEKVAPYAVKTIKAPVPSVLVYAERVSAVAIRLQQYAAGNIKPNDTLKLVIEGEDATVTVQSVSSDINDTTVTFAETLPAGETIYVYGHVVDDFKVIESERLLPMVFNSVKQLHSKLASQQNTIESLMDRLHALENRMLYNV